jgi:hypothetical protein
LTLTNGESERRQPPDELNKYQRPGDILQKISCLIEDAMVLQQVDLDDIVAVDRREDVRIIVSIAGHYSLDHRRDARGERRTFACRAINISSRAVALAAPVCGKIGERVIAQLDQIGKLQGVVTRSINGGFVMSIIASGDERNRLAAKIEWLDKFKNHDVPERRADERIPLKKAIARLILPDGRRENCVVLDLSVSGAGISAESIPDVGAIVTVGAVRARVMRHFNGGFGVQFIERQNPSTVAAVVILE